MIAQASVRGDDARRPSPLGRLRWIKDAKGRARSLITQAAAIQTFPRHWVVSAYSSSRPTVTTLAMNDQR